MRLVAFSVVVACAWFVAVNLVASTVAWWLTPAVVSRTAGFDAAGRASALFAWRMWPSVLSLMVSIGVAWPSFLMHESSSADEPLTGWLIAAIAIAVALLAMGVGAVWRASRAAHVRATRWKAGARPVGPGTLLVARDLATAAVAGVWRPTVFVSRRLSDVLTPGELRAVLAHEWAHAAARDNVKRALLLAAPDPMRFTRRGATIVEGWMTATEHAADDRVAALGRAAAVDLASALVKAARVLGAGGAEPALVRNVAGHGDLPGRVLRLLDDADSHRRATVLWPRLLMRGLAAVMVLGPAVCTPAFSPAVHAVSEFFVNGRF